MAGMMKGTKRLSHTLKRLPDAVEDAVKPALNKSGDELATTMKRLAPVDEGDLRDSITVTRIGETTPPYSQPGGSRQAKENEVIVTAGNSRVRYAHLVEFGTSQAAAQPFFWPAYRLLKKRLKSRISRSIGKAVKEGFER